jgi:Domain of unknown function (DUF1990)
MKIYLKDQAKHFEKHFKSLQSEEIIKYDKTQLNEKTTLIEIISKKELADFDLSFFWAYNIFPKNIMTFLTEWAFQNRQMQIGDTILQQAFIPPLRQFSQKILFGVRINQIIDEPSRKGFSYETLNGHVEMGESIFTIEKHLSDKTIFKIHTFSKPGNFLSKLVGPIFSVPYQSFCTKKGLENVKKQLELQG